MRCAKCLTELDVELSVWVVVWTQESGLKVNQPASFSVSLNGAKGVIDAKVHSPSGALEECCVTEIDEGKRGDEENASGTEYFVRLQTYKPFIYLNLLASQVAKENNMACSQIMLSSFNAVFSTSSSSMFFRMFATDSYPGSPAEGFACVSHMNSQISLVIQHINTIKTISYCPPCLPQTNMLCDLFREKMVYTWLMWSSMAPTFPEAPSKSGLGRQARQEIQEWCLHTVLDWREAPQVPTSVVSPQNVSVYCFSIAVQGLQGSNAT